MALPCIIPIGPIFSMLGAWLRGLKERITRDSRDPNLKQEVEIFGFSDAHKLPLPENDAVALSKSMIARNDFEAAKHVLVNAWLLLPAEEKSEPAYIALREGFTSLYLARGEDSRAEKIASMPILLLDREVQWIVTHPHEQIGGSAVGEVDLYKGKKN